LEFTQSFRVKSRQERFDLDSNREQLQSLKKAPTTGMCAFFKNKMKDIRMCIESH
jgi:hypothetical protein